MTVLSLLNCQRGWTLFSVAVQWRCNVFNTKHHFVFTKSRVVSLSCCTLFAKPIYDPKNSFLPRGRKLSRARVTIHHQRTPAPQDCLFFPRRRRLLFYSTLFCCLVYFFLDGLFFFTAAASTSSPAAPASSSAPAPAAPATPTSPAPPAVRRPGRGAPLAFFTPLPSARGG